MTAPLPNIEHVISPHVRKQIFRQHARILFPATTNPDGGGVPTGWSNPLDNAPNIAAWNAPVGSAAQNLPFPDTQESYADMNSQIIPHRRCEDLPTTTRQ